MMVKIKMKVYEKPKPKPKVEEEELEMVKVENLDINIHSGVYGMVAKETVEGITSDGGHSYGTLIFIPMLSPNGAIRNWKELVAEEKVVGVALF